MLGPGSSKKGPAHKPTKSDGPKKSKGPKKGDDKKKDHSDPLLDFEMIVSIYQNDIGRFNDFLSRGASPNAVYRGWSALMLAVYHNNMTIVRTLLHRGASVNYTSPRGLTALSVARYYRRVAIAQELIRRGAARKRLSKGGKMPAIPDPNREQF